jgi:Ran GTPase-activating protein (RanGAP) involved in mRNA processing and transport
MNCEKLVTLNLIGPYFVLQNNSSDNISLIGETIPKIITRVNKLTSFSIQYIPIELNIFNNLKNALMNSKITNLGLSYTKIPENKFVEFSQYLKGNQILTEINFSGHNCNIPTLLKNTIFSSDNNIISLSLSDNNLSEKDIEIISNFLIQFPKIKKLNISKNNLSQKSCIVLGSTLNKNTTLEEINLSSCGINGETIAILLSNKGSSIFKNVFLDNNNIEDLGLIMFSQFIKNSSNLNIISLRNVNGSDKGFNPIISTILVSKSQIKEIHLDRNKLINDEIVNTIIKSKDIYIEKGITFYVNASCVKNKDINYNCIKLIS